MRTLNEEARQKEKKLKFRIICISHIEAPTKDFYIEREVWEDQGKFSSNVHEINFLIRKEQNNHSRRRKKELSL